MGRSSKRIHQLLQHRSPEQSIEIRSLRSNHHFPRHSHDHYGLGLVDEGGHRSWSGMGVVTAYQGDVIMVNPGEMHDGAPLCDQPRSWRMIYFDASLAEDDFPGERAYLRPVSRDPQLRSAILDLFAQLVCSEQGDLGFEQSLVMALGCLWGGAPTFSSSSAPVVSRARERIDDAPQLEVTLSELARLCDISRFQLVRAFKRDFGITPHAYLIQARANMARRLILRGKSLSAAAVQTGFADQSHLNRVFLRQFGVTPGSLRRAISFKTTGDYR
jgi:AraC-like DNA-binding protein